MSRKEEAYDYLLEAILSNTLPPGTPIIETEIAATLKTSRTPVREALKQLEADGLVIQYAQKGTFVSDISPHDIEEIFSLRIMLEVFALQESYSRIPDEELIKVEKMFSALETDSPREDYARADKTLHSLIVDNAGNYRLKQILRFLNGQIERFRRTAARGPKGLSKSKGQHLEIVQLLRRRDLKGAEESLKNHLNTVKTNTLESVKIFLMNKNGTRQI
jgi:DNA-binding GntR family transcriptional regulator